MALNGKNRTALVTGGLGFSASYVIRELLDQGWCVRLTDLPKYPDEILSQYDGRVDYVQGDITKPETLKPAFEDIDTMFHTAAIFSYSAPMEVLRKVNVQGTKNVLEQSIKNDVKKAILWSSGAIYGKADPKFYEIPIKELPVEQLNPKSGGRYDTSKREQEAAARLYWEENGFPITYMRIASMYGPRSFYGIYYLLKYVRDEILNFIPANLHNASMSMAHASDVARAAIFLSDPKRFNGEAYNIADDNALDFIDTLKYVASLVDSKFAVTLPYPRTLMFQAFQVIAAWSRFEAKHLRKKERVNGKNPIPKLEIDSLRYMFGNYWMDNKKLLDTGFRLNYSDRTVGLAETISWYNTYGWEPEIAMKNYLAKIKLDSVKDMENMTTLLKTDNKCWDSTKNKPHTSVLEAN